MSSFRMIVVGLFLVFTVAPSASSGYTNPCQSQQYGQRLKSLSNIVFKGEDKNYKFDIRICHDVDKYAGAAIVQFDKKDSKNYTIGKTANLTVKAGSNWMLLTYGDGDAYKSHCNKRPRKGLIMLTCAAGTSSTVKVLEEYRETTPVTNDCYYLFEIATGASCGNDNGPPLPLSPGSIFVIVVIALLAGFLVLGILLKCLLYGARGKEAVPCYDLWTTFFTLQADGCDYMCRCKKSFTSTGDWENRDNDYSPELFQDKKSSADDRLLSP
ncbi:expressed hypothetical protein [Trichoplax adhaerens]|uniref:MRH domain-containing protein n=1 Tax=Trichoplax adhaerens TaxID=10228 RepID=B3S052_TRIAD|nr:expressed hypothetical protein [Trichoplax adhaerens]EDV23944.1 expressed hypothetical protein [Trichoplax adhaerens]|eukprot:XP_002113470.1 expressed hypothetical protein [Trichoplax adhaerens]